MERSEIRLGRLLSEHWVFVARYERYRAEPWRAIVGFGVAAAILVGLFVYQRRKRRLLETDRERFESLVAERTLS